MIKTLHLYIFRELFKTFVLTTVALTVLVTMGGGVANVFRSQGLDAIRVMKVFALLVPIAATLVMPVAALFAATITYGRASTDNEINACRAAGINVHWLLLSAIGLAVGVGVFSYYSWNYFIPGLTGRLADLGRQDVSSILLGNLKRNRGFRYGNYALYADRAAEVPREQLPAGAPPDNQYLLLQSVAFLEFDDRQPVRCGTTEHALIEFDMSGVSPRVRISLTGVHTFDTVRRQYMELDQQYMGPYDIPIPLARKTRFADLPTLQRYATEPHSIPELDDRAWGVRVRLQRIYTYLDALRHFDPEQGGDGRWTLRGPHIELEVRAGRFAPAEDDLQPSLQDVRVTERLLDDEGKIKSQRVLTAPSGVIRVVETLDRTKPVVQVELSNGVEIRQVPAPAGEAPVKRPTERLANIPIPEAVQQELAALTQADLYNPAVKVPGPPKLQEVRRKLFDEKERLLCDVICNIQFRSSYAVSALPVIVLGAVLGVILRGGQVLTAFGISCIPSLISIVASILGRNLADHPRTHEIGILVMWCANGGLSLALVAITARFMRR